MRRKSKMEHPEHISTQIQFDKHINNNVVSIFVTYVRTSTLQHTKEKNMNRKNNDEVTTTRK